jgi:hypothetical protein
MQRCVVPLKYVFQEIQNTPALCVKVSYLKYQYVVVQVTILPVAVVTEIALVAILLKIKWVLALIQQQKETDGALVLVILLIYIPLLLMQNKEFFVVKY